VTREARATDSRKKRIEKVQAFGWALRIRLG
jgi:hypothetical protein